jgi:F-type H+-transporting ATPase subunit delta
MFASNMPSLIPQQYAKILYDLTANAPENEIDGRVRVFLQRVRGDQMLGKMGYIIDAFEEYAKAKDGVIHVKVVSAMKGDDGTDLILSKQKKDIEIEKRVDANIIGGAVIQSGNTVYNGSVKAQLKRLRQAWM